MKKIKSNHTLRFAVLLCTALPLFSADHGDWAALRGLHRGDSIGVVQADLRRIEGRFESVTETAIVLQSEGAVTVPQRDVVRVYKRGMSRKKRMLIGTVAGLGAGAVTAILLSQHMNSEGPFSGPGGSAGTAASLAGGAGIGLAIGSLSGDGYKTIYQRTGKGE